MTHTMPDRAGPTQVQAASPHYARLLDPSTDRWRDA
jgi:hypothetical protein